MHPVIDQMVANDRQRELREQAAEARRVASLVPRPRIAQLAGAYHGSPARPPSRLGDPYPSPPRHPS